MGRFCFRGLKTKYGFNPPTWYTYITSVRIKYTYLWCIYIYIYYYLFIHIHCIQPQLLAGLSMVKILADDTNAALCTRYRRAIRHWSSYGHQSLGIFVNLLVQFRMVKIKIQTMSMIFDPQFKPGDIPLKSKDKTPRMVTFFLFWGKLLLTRRSSTACWDVTIHPFG